MAHLRKRISIVLVDDNPADPDGVATLIRAHAGFRVLAVSADAEAALGQIRGIRPDLVLLHLRPEGDDTITLAGALHGEAPASRVIIIGLHATQNDVAGLLRAGVSGFIMAGATFDTFLATIRAVAMGGQVLPSELTRSLFSQLKQHGVQERPERILDLGRLTAREREVADLIVLGWSNREIALRLRVAPHTVKGHVHRVLSKLAVDSRLEVAAFTQNRSGARDGSSPEPVAPPALEPLPSV